MAAHIGQLMPRQLAFALLVKNNSPLLFLLVIFVDLPSSFSFFIIFIFTMVSTILEEPNYNYWVRFHPKRALLKTQNYA